MGKLNRSENSIKNHWNGSVKKKANLNAPMCASMYSSDFNAEGKMTIAKPSSEENVPLDQRVDTNLSLGTMYARENQAQSLDSETRTDDECHTKPQSTAVLNETSNESCEGAAGKTSPVRSEANIVSLVSAETPKSGSLRYKPLQLKDLDILSETGRLPTTDIYTQKTSIPNSFYNNIQANYTEGMFVDCTSPEAILRTAAKSFKNTPSIMRKVRSQLSKKNTSSDIHIQKVDAMFNSTMSPCRLLDFSP